MRCISLWQPWASLVAISAKQYETRSWSTSYRGLLVIHAAKRTTEVKELEQAAYYSRNNPPKIGTFMWYCLQSIYRHHEQRIGSLIPKLPLGAALCIAELIDVLPVEAVRESISMQEYEFGDYSDGRYAWKLANVRQFVEPVPMRGAQGLFNPPPFVMPVK